MYRLTLYNIGRLSADGGFHCLVRCVQLWKVVQPRRFVVEVSPGIETIRLSKQYLVLGWYPDEISFALRSSNFTFRQYLIRIRSLLYHALLLLGWNMYWRFWNRKPNDWLAYLPAYSWCDQCRGWSESWVVIFGSYIYMHPNCWFMALGLRLMAD